MSDLFNLETTAQNSLQLPSLVQSAPHANYSTEQLTAPRRLNFITVTLSTTEQPPDLT